MPSLLAKQDIGFKSQPDAAVSRSYFGLWHYPDAPGPVAGSQTSADRAGSVRVVPKGDIAPILGLL
jgi:hypothetical protein